MASYVRFKKCLMENCGNDNRQCPDLSFFLFPKGNYGEWMAACGNVTLKIDKRSKRPEMAYVSAQHFSRSDYNYILSPFRNARNLLKSSAVPKRAVQDQAAGTVPAALGATSLGTPDARPALPLATMPGAATPATPNKTAGTVPPALGATTPATPGTSRAATPAASRPATPGTSIPATPGTSRPATPGTSRPATPGTSRPATSASSKQCCSSSWRETTQNSCSKRSSSLLGDTGPPVVPCKRRLFASPSGKTIALENSRPAPERKLRERLRRKSKVLYKRLNTDNFLRSVSGRLGPYLSAFVKHKLRGKRSHTMYHKWLAVNILVSSSETHYQLMWNLVPLPSLSTVRELMTQFQVRPGKSAKSVSMLEMKVKPVIRSICQSEAHKFNQFHIKLKGSSVSSCDACSQILTKQDLNLHIFTTFKENVESCDQSLTYCSKNFIDLIILYERVFLYCFHKHRHVSEFRKLVCKFLDLCQHHCNFCCVQVTDKLKQFFAVCRTLQCTRHVNRLMSSESSTEKLKKIVHE